MLFSDSNTHLNDCVVKLSQDRLFDLYLSRACLCAQTRFWTSMKFMKSTQTNGDRVPAKTLDCDRGR